MSTAESMNYVVATSFAVEGAVHARWLELLTERYLPFLAEQGYPHHIFTRVLSEQAQSQITYSLQLPVATLDDYRKITGELFSEYETIAQGLFGDQVLYFTTLLKNVDTAL